MCPIVCYELIFLPSDGGKGLTDYVEVPFLAPHMVTSILSSETMTILLGLLFIVILRVEGCLNFNVVYARLRLVI